MATPYRIKRPRIAKFTTMTSSPEPQEFKLYLDRLTTMIPGEVIGLYLVGNGFIPLEQGYVQLFWSIFCLVAVVMIRCYGSSDIKRGIKPQWETVIISAIAFVIWVYSLGGPFATFKVYIPYIGSLLVLAWTFLVPYFYKGTQN